LAEARRDAETILAMLRASGGRTTSTRRVTVDVLLAAGDEHLSAEDIAARVRSQLPDVAESTIYRTLGALEELGVVTHVHLGHGPSTYHLGPPAHQHLVCRQCGAVLEVPEAEFAGLARTITNRYGFVIEPGHFSIAGRCERCRT
jgi:Fur family ferric uptake transcriptional regulator